MRKLALVMAVATLSGCSVTATVDVIGGYDYPPTSGDIPVYVSERLLIGGKWEPIIQIRFSGPYTNSKIREEANEEDAIALAKKYGANALVRVDRTTFVGFRKIE